MLILKRNPGEAVQIGDLITIHFFDRNRIGIDSPRDLAVVRSELLARAVAACVDTTKENAANVEDK